MVGFYFVPPYHEEGLAAAVLRAPVTARPPKTGRLVVHKRATDPNDANRRFERRGFVFQVTDEQGQPVGGQLVTDSAGRAVSDSELEIGKSYVLQELHSPVTNVQLTPTPFTTDKANKPLRIGNTVTQPNTPYGA